MTKVSDGSVGTKIETIVIFPPASLVKSLEKDKRETKQRTQSMSGLLGEKIAKAVEEKHLDRKAFSMACQLNALDDQRLHITYMNLLKYCEDLGITKRATAQEELFDAEEAEEEKEPVGKLADVKPAKPAKAAKAAKEAPAKPKGRAPRAVAEAEAGSNVTDFKPMH
jgi:hypothetical protein